MHTESITPLRQVAIALGRMERGREAALGFTDADITHYCKVVTALEDRPRPGRHLSQEGAVQVANAVLTGRTLNAVSFVCVSDYVGGVRFQSQGGQFALLPAEQEMLQRAERLRTICAENDVTLCWRLVLADAWGTVLYPERLIPGGIDAYCAMMEAECSSRGFEALRWTQFMRDHAEAYRVSEEAAVQMITEYMVRWEAFQGEIAHDKPNKARALDLARTHILMRAAEGRVLVEVFGTMLVLSTETRALQRYDNLVVPRCDYCGHDWMPKYPHRMESLTGKLKD